MIEVLPKSRKHVLALKAHLRQKWLAFQQSKERLQGRLEEVHAPPPGLTGEPGTVVEFPELGMFYQNFHGDTLFLRASGLKHLKNENLIGFLKLMKRSPPAFKFHDLLKTKVQRRAIQVKKEEEKKGAGSSK